MALPGVAPAALSAGQAALLRARWRCRLAAAARAPLWRIRALPTEQLAQGEFLLVAALLPAWGGPPGMPRGAALVRAMADRLLLGNRSAPLWWPPSPQGALARLQAALGPTMAGDGDASWAPGPPSSFFPFLVLRFGILILMCVLLFFFSLYASSELPSC